MTTNGGIVIVGGGLAASRTAEQLRRAEYAGPITLISDEDHLPYDRPPLSKDVLRAEVDDTTLKPAEFYDENNITLLLGAGAAKLDTEAQTVTLTNGEVVAYDELVIATGLVPRTIPSLPDLEGIRVLRTHGESMALREHATRAKRAVVIGAGFIGCEVAASLRKLGVDVTIVEPQPTPLASVLGTEIGELVARLHRAEGVDVRCGVGVTGVSGSGHVEKVQLADGTLLPCFPRGKKSELACGDQVAVMATGEGQGVVEKVMERSSLLYRSNEFRQKLIAANVTQIAIVVATEPSFSDSNSNSTSPVSASEMIVPTGILSVMSAPAAPNISEPMPCSPFLASWRRENR